MSKFVICHSFEQYEIVDASWFMCIGDNWLSFSSTQKAEQFLRPFLNEHENIDALRNLLGSIPGSEGYGLSPQDISQRVNELLVEGRLRIRPYDKMNDQWETSFGLPLGGWDETKPAEIKSEPENIAEEVPVQTSWVEIQFTDALGNPLAGELTQITDSEGLTQQFKTNANGIVHLKQVPEGNCDVVFPNLGDNSWIQE